MYLVALIRDTHTLRIDTYFQYVSQYAITYEYDMWTIRKTLQFDTQYVTTYQYVS